MHASRRLVSPETQLRANSANHATVDSEDLLSQASPAKLRALQRNRGRRARPPDGPAKRQAAGSGEAAKIPDADDKGKAREDGTARAQCVCIGEETPPVHVDLRSRRKVKPRRNADNPACEMCYKSRLRHCCGCALLQQCVNTQGDVWACKACIDCMRSMRL